MAKLLEPAAYPHPVGPIQLVETHISWVFLTGPFAYKVKKPVRLEFLDFSSLDARRHFCAEEVRLNRRFAPELYLGTVPICGPADAPRVDGPGTPIEWAVKLVQFDQSDLLDARFEAGKLSVADCQRLGAEIARVQATEAIAAPADGHGTSEGIRAVAGMNLGEIRRHRPDAATRVDRIEAWLAERITAGEGAFRRRIEDGRIRECHGDLHLANVVLLDGRPVAFDSIEFNADLRWIDVASDIAFLSMDLESRGRPDLAAHVTSAWMEAADDHAAAAVLPVHRVARAVVRAAVAAIRGGQAGGQPAAGNAARRDCDRYLELAERLMARSRPALLATVGVAGVGKTTLAAECVGAFAAVRLRSDVERKRAAGMAATDRPGSEASTEALYSTAMTRHTYDRLAAIARSLLEAGTSVVIDATCNRRWQRDRITTVAGEASAPLVWLDIDLPLDLILERVAARSATGEDPSDATVDTVREQLATREPIHPSECAEGSRGPAPIHVRVGAGDLATPSRLLGAVAARLESLPGTERSPWAS
jgi:hypothetical protein